MHDRRTILRAGFAAAAVMAWDATGTIADGTATPSERSGIPSVAWNLVSIDTGDDSIAPEQGAIYRLQFLPNGQLNITADCNTAGGKYDLDGDQVTFHDTVTTLVACANEDFDGLFWQSLGDVSSWSVSSDGSDQLVLAIGGNEQAMVFAAGLTDVIWQWQQLAGGPDQAISPVDPSRYTIEFKNDDSIVMHADCNSGKGTAQVDGNQITMQVGMTRRACGEGSSFAAFSELLDTASSYIIRNGMLYLNLPADGGTATFKAVLPDTSHDATPTS